MKQNSLIFRFDLSLPLAMAFAVLGGTQANAVDRTWGNTGTDFETGANWAGGTAPANSNADLGRFTAATATFNPEFTADRTIRGLQFDSGTAAWTFTGSGGTRTLTLGATSALINNSANTQTFSAGLQLIHGASAAIDFKGNTGALQIDSAFNFPLSGRSIRLGGATGGEISGIISGPGQLFKQDSGTWTLNGDNTFTGSTLVVGGVLKLGHTNALSGSTFDSYGVGTLSFGSLTSATFGGLYHPAFTPQDLALTNDSNNPVALTFGGNNENNDFHGTISGDGSLIKVGTSWIAMYSASTYTGGTTINEGEIYLSHEQALGTGPVTFNGTASALVVDVDVQPPMQVANNFVLNGNGTIQVGATLTTTFLGDISGAGNLINESDGGTLVLSGNNTHATTTINGGVLAVTNGAAIANTGTVILADAAGATLTVQDSETIGSLRGGGATGGDVIIASGQTLTVAETGSQTFAGIIGDAGGLAKTGVGTLTLTGTNTYTGPTSVTGGQLVVNGSSSDSAHTVGNGGTLGGTGTVGALVVQNGGTISPGNNPGILSSGSTTWLDGGNYNWQVLDADGAAGPTGWDKLAITGVLDLSNLTAGGFNVNVWSLSDALTSGNALNFDGSLSYSWTIATASVEITGFDAGDFTIFTAANNGTNGFTNPFPGGFSMSVTGNDLNLNYGPTPVPEPGSAFTVLALFSGAVLNRRKRVVKH
jgi:autotransporter-associated beta strand protein